MKSHTSASPAPASEAQRKPIPQSYSPLVKKLVSAAQHCLEKGVDLDSSAFVCNLTTKHVITVPIHGLGAAHKEMTAQTIKDAARTSNADCIIIVMNAWVRHHIHAESYQTENEQYGGLAKNPSSISSVVVTVETYDGHWMAIRPVIAFHNDPKRRTFEKMEFAYMGSIEGRFIGLLKPLS